MGNINVRVKKLQPQAKIPSYAHPHDAGMDMYSCERVCVKKGERGMIHTGIAMEIPAGYVGLCWDKSGLATKKGIKVFAGVIDAGYRGEIVLSVANFGQDDVLFEVGDKVLQMLIQPVEQAFLEDIGDGEFEQSSRGNSGFGSTGHK